MCAITFGADKDARCDEAEEAHRARHGGGQTRDCACRGRAIRRRNFVESISSRRIFGGGLVQ